MHTDQAEFWHTTSIATSQEGKPQPLHHLAQNSQNLVSDCKVPYLCSMIPTQEQPKKGKYVPKPIA